MTTREQLHSERIDALLRLISEENETEAGEMPTAPYVERLLRCRSLGEAHRVCNWCEKAGYHLTEREP